MQIGIILIKGVFQIFKLLNFTNKVGEESEVVQATWVEVQVTWVVGVMEEVDTSAAVMQVVEAMEGDRLVGKLKFNFVNDDEDVFCSRNVCPNFLGMRTQTQ